MVLKHLGLAVTAILGILLTVVHAASAQTMRAHFIDVGQGDATLIEFPCAAILVDTGGEKNGLFDSTEALLDYLESFFTRRSDLDATLHSLVLTHPHIDHTRAVKAVLGKYTVLNAVTNGQESSSGKHGQKALHKKVTDGEATPDDTDDDVGFSAVWRRDIPEDAGLTSAAIDPVNCQDVGVDPKITALWGMVAEDLGWGSSHFGDQNNHSVALRIDFGEASLLLTGDLEEAAIPDFIAHYRDSDLLDIDVYQAGHHGSHNGTTARLLHEITPEIAVISMGPFTRMTSWTAWAYGHPRKTVVGMLQEHVTNSRPSTEKQVASGVKTFEPMTIDRAIYATGWDGTVVLEGDIDGTWRVIQPIQSSALLNINTASIDELISLPMIGHGRGSAIVIYRSANGPFTTVDDLDDVPGIGPATLEAIRHLVTTGG